MSSSVLEMKVKSESYAEQTCPQAVYLVGCWQGEVESHLDYVSRTWQETG